MATTTTDFTPLRFRHNDTIIIRNLRFDGPVEAPEAWDPLHKPGRLQPAVVSLVVYLRHGFPSAAAADALDGNTLHYGELSKKIREEAHYQAQIAETRGDLESNNPTVADLMTSVRRIVQQRPAAAEAVEGVDVELSLPKGSMFGSTVRIIDEDIWLAGGSIGRRNRRFQVEGIHTACLIGVNTIERTGRQPLVLDFEIHEQGVPTVEAAPDVYSRLRRAFNVEKLLVNIIEQTSFETLERLIEHTYTQLRAAVLDEHFPGAVFRLSIAKPRAIIFADAPIVEIRRTIPS